MSDSLTLLVTGMMLVVGVLLAWFGADWFDLVAGVM